MLIGLAAAFAVVNGANDGGAIVASTLRVPGQRPLASLAVLAAALVVVPLVWGTGVADTLTSGLVRAPEGRQATLIAVGVTAAVLVVVVLTRAGLPTSLTLGMVGGIVGAGLGTGLPVLVAGVGRVVAIGLAAPMVGAVLAQLLTPAVQAAMAGGYTATVALGWAASVAQAVAYAANDGQKMIAVVIVSALGVSLPVVAAVALLFAVGAVPGIRPAAGTLRRAVSRGGPAEQMTAQLGGAAAVLGSAAVGVPVSMTQAVAGGLVGTGMLRGRRQVRWRVAAQLALAWAVTLPSAAVAGALVAVAVGRFA
jgi:PiT family inorganic phosphate transporter